ncbi:MAG: low molecular weight phosphotyrosine protein phosphatase [Bacilli bacterium]|nr:low molecular weight phosphotyrosine protein phosphatase [Bacilli bacterium]
MMRICFVCLGNICRSPMAEFIMKDKISKLGRDKDFYIESRATSFEEDGNDMYPLAKKVLDEKGIPYTRHYAKRLEKADYNKFDLFICMEEANVRNIKYIFDDPYGKVIKLLDRDISDPWYTGDFIKTYNDLDYGIDLFLKKNMYKY